MFWRTIDVILKNKCPSTRFISSHQIILFKYTPEEKTKVTISIKRTTHIKEIRVHKDIHQERRNSSTFIHSLSQVNHKGNAKLHY